MNNIPATPLFSTILFKSFSLFKKSILIPIVTIFIFSSCNNSPKQPDKKEESITKIQAKNCYIFTSEKDSVFMDINVEGNLVNGNLVYKLFQKDLNKGTIQGSMKGDTLIATYKFISEGTESVREVAFLKKGNTFIEGFGDVEEKNGGMVFKITNSLNFNSIIILQHNNGGCKKLIPEKFDN